MQSYIQTVESTILRGMLVICPVPLYYIFQAGSYQIGGMVVGMAVTLAHPYYH